MRVVPLKEVLGLGAGELVLAIHVTVKDVGKRYTGKNEHGDWSIQSVAVEDATGSLKLKCMNRDEFPGKKGQSVIIACAESDKGLTGLKAEDDEYKGKVSRVVRVTGSATIEVVAPSTSAPAPVPAPVPATTTSQPAAVPAPAPGPAPALTPEQQARIETAKTETQKRVDAALAAWARLYLRCLEAGDWIEAERKRTAKGPHAQMTPEQFQACVSSLFIQATRNGF